MLYVELKTEVKKATGNIEIDKKMEVWTLLEE